MITHRVIQRYGKAPRKLGADHQWRSLSACLKNPTNNLHCAVPKQIYVSDHNINESEPVEQLTNVETKCLGYYSPEQSFYPCDPKS